MKKINRVWQGIIAVLLICACALFTLVACGDTDEQNKRPNNGNDTSQSQQPSNDDDNNNTTHTPSSGSEDDDDENNSSQTPSDDEDPVTPPVEEISESEYKAMFEEKLPTVIEEYFNENLAEKERRMISNVNVKAYNNFDGTIYFSCKQNGGSVFMSVKSIDMAGSSTFKELSEKLELSTFITDNVIGVVSQEQSLANEIAAFALEQQEVKDYITANSIDPTGLQVLNATEFEAVGGYRKTTLTILSEDTIFTLSLSGRAGTCSTQEDYLTKFKNGYLDKVEIGEAISFEELKVEEGAAACVYEITLPSGVGD